MIVLFVIMALANISTELLQERFLLGQFARHDLLTFAKLSTPHPFEPLNPKRSKFDWKIHHQLLADNLQQLESGKIRALEIEMPPRYGKTEMAVRNYVSWHAGKHPDRDLLIVTATADLANEHGRDVRDYIRGPGYALAFGGNPKCRLRDDSQSATRLQLVGGAKLQFFGRGQIPAGVGGFGVVFDDFFKSAEEAYSKVERATAWRNYVADCLSRLNNSSAWKLLIGSRKHPDDVQGRQFDPTNEHYDEASAREFVRIRIPALSEGKDIDPLGREKDEVCWPERFPASFYIAKRTHRSEIVRIDFQTQDQCNPLPEEGTWFKKDWLKEYKLAELPKRLRIYIASDHAYRIQEKNDFNCLLVCGIDPAGEIWILASTIWRKCDTAELTDEIFKLIETQRPAQWWAARDAISGSIMPLLKRRMLDTHKFFHIDDSIAEKKDLVARSSAIRGYMAMGMVHFPADWPQWSQAKKQLLEFPGDKDDFIAALAMLGMGMDKMIKAPGDRRSDVPRKGTFAWHSFGQEKKDGFNKVRGWV